MVETILNGKPEERRRIFEEAAGITKYKQRRKAAFRKLEATAADILRLNDIISEVEKNVGSLSRQVKRAQRYQEIKEQLQEDEIKLATHQFSKIKIELEPLIEKLNESQDNRVALTTRFDEQEAEIEKSRTKLLELERKLSAQQKELNEVSLKIHKKEEEILVGRERRKALEVAKVRLLKEKEEISVRMEKNKAEILQSKEELQHLFEQIQLAENDYQEKSAELSSFEMRVHDKYEQLKKIENQRLHAVEGLTESKQEEERIKTQLENLDERIKSINRELEESQLLEKIREDKIAKLQEKKASQESELTKLKQQLKDVQDELTTLGESKEKVKERILNKNGEAQALKERIALLKKFIESYEDHPEGVQHLLLHGYLNGGCKGTLGENLTVESTYRRAVETAMGEAAVSLIVEASDQALECIEVLKADEKGAVTFFPLDNFSTQKIKSDLLPQNNDILQANGVIDWAHNLVQCEKEYRPIVQSLLRDFLIVEDLQTAKQHADKLRENRINLITLGGEVVSNWGPIKGGANGESQAGVIGRKALVEELESKLKETWTQLDKEEKEQQEIESKYQKAFSRERDLGKQVKVVLNLS